MPSPNEKFPNALQAFLLLVALFLGQLLAAAVLQSLRAILPMTRTELWVLSDLLAHGGMFVAVMQIKGLGYRDLFHPSSASPGATFALLVPPVLMLVPALVLVMAVVSAVLVRLVPMSDWQIRMFETMSANNLPTLLAVCVLAPVLEEMLFRGIVLRGFLQQYPRRHAILGSALLFGAAHMNLYQFVVAGLLGALLGWLYERTRSLIPCIALHGGYNSTLMLLSLWANDDATTSAMAPNAVPPGMAAAWLLALLLAVPGALALRRMLVTGRGSRD